MPTSRMTVRVPLRWEVLLMRAFQSRITGPVLRRIAGPQNIVEMGMAFWSSRVVPGGR